MTTARENFKFQRWITLLSVVLFSIKISAYYLTGSLSIFSDALESIINIVAGFIGLYSLYVVAQPSDQEHPYGHGKAEYISAAIEGAMVFGAGVIILYQVVLSFFKQTTLHKLDWGIWLIGVTAVINFLAGWYSIQLGKKNHSLALQASGKHLQTDTYSTIGVVAGIAIMQITQLFWLDKIIAIIMSIWIMYSGYQILRQSIAGIMDEADLVLLRTFVDVINKNRTSNWIDLHNLRVIKYGSKLHIDCHLTLPWYLNLQEAHAEIDLLSEVVTKEMEHAVEWFVHTDPCIMSSCSICLKEDCSERKNSFQSKIEWTLDNTLKNEKHSL